MNKIVVFGFMDTLTGQVFNMLSKKILKRVQFIVSTKKLKEIDISKEHSRRPNNKTEFINKKKIFGKKVIFCKKFIPLLKKNNIKACYIFEENQKERKKIFNTLKKNNIKILSFIHDSVKLMGLNKIEEGAIIFPNCYIGYKTDIGKCTFIQSNCCIEHHSVVGNFSDLNPRVTTGGFVKIGDSCTVHMCTDIINRVIINNYVKIGAGSLVLKNINVKGLYYGRPVKIKKIKIDNSIIK